MQEETLLHSFLVAMGLEQIKTVGRNVMCTCPFHPEKDGSFSISLDEISKWQCFGCGVKGITIKSLIRRSGKCGMESWEDMEVDKTAGNNQYTLAKVPLKNYVKKQNENEQKNFRWSDYEHLTKTIPQYAFDRGVTLEQAKKWRLGLTEDKRLFIPVFDHNKGFVGYSSRAIPPLDKPKYKHAPGFAKSRYFYGEEFIDLENTTVIIVEGFMDLWALDRFGVKNVLANMGTDASDYQLLKLLKWANNIVIIPDNDEPGMLAAGKWKEALKPLGKSVIISSVIAGKKDVGEWNCQEIRYMLKRISENHQIEIPLSG